MTELDRETTAAVRDLAGRLRDRDPEVDPELFAREFMLALRGRGWRPTEARAPIIPKPAAPGAGAQALRPETTVLLRDLHADVEARAAAARAAKETVRGEGAR